MTHAAAAGGPRRAGRRRHGPGRRHRGLGARRLRAATGGPGFCQAGKVNAVLCLRGRDPRRHRPLRLRGWECASGLQRVQLDTGVPVVFGVLTTDTLEQALERSRARSVEQGSGGGADRDRDGSAPAHPSVVVIEGVLLPPDGHSWSVHAVDTAWIPDLPSVQGSGDRRIECTNAREAGPGGRHGSTDEREMAHTDPAGVAGPSAPAWTRRLSPRRSARDPDGGTGRGGSGRHPLPSRGAPGRAVPRSLRHRAWVPPGVRQGGDGAGAAARPRDRRQLGQLAAGARAAGRAPHRRGPGPPRSWPFGEATGRLHGGGVRQRDAGPAQRAGDRPGHGGGSLTGRWRGGTVRLPVPRALRTPGACRQRGSRPDGEPAAARRRRTRCRGVDATARHPTGQAR